MTVPPSNGPLAEHQLVRQTGTGPARGGDQDLGQDPGLAVVVVLRRHRHQLDRHVRMRPPKELGDVTCLPEREPAPARRDTHALRHARQEAPGPASPPGERISAS